MSLINDALKKAQHVQALKGSGAPAAYHPAPSKDAAPSESISNVMPETKPSRGRMGTIIITAVLGLVTLGGAGYMFFLRSDTEAVVVQRRPAGAPPVAPVAPSAPVTPSEPAAVQDTAPETTEVASALEPAATTTPDSFFHPSSSSTETATAEEPALVVDSGPALPAPVVETETVTEPVTPIEEAPVAVAETSPVTPLETVTEPEPEAVPAVTSPAAAAAEVAAEEPAVVEATPTPGTVVAFNPPTPAPEPEPTVEVVESPVTAPAPAAPPAPEPVAAPVAVPPAPPTEPAPEPVAVVSAPPPQPVSAADPEIELWVNAIKVAGLRLGPVPKVLMNDRVYAQGEMVQFDFELRIIEITDKFLKFQDPKGHIYFYHL